MDPVTMLKTACELTECEVSPMAQLMASLGRTP